MICLSLGELVTAKPKANGSREVTSSMIVGLNGLGCEGDPKERGLEVTHSEKSVIAADTIWVYWSVRR